MANPLHLSDMYLSFTSVQTSLSEMGHQGDPQNYTRNLRACVTIHSSKFSTKPSTEKPAGI